MKKLILVSALIACAPAAAQDIAPYIQGGISGFGGGISFGTGTPLRIRADLYHGISRSVDQTESGIRYTGRVKYSESGLYLDWYPTQSKFRLSGGVFLNSSKINLDANPGPGFSADINGRLYSLGAGDQVSVTVKYPSVMPYIGVGWGMGSSDKGWAFVADVGMAFGRPTTTLDASASLRARITAAGLNAESELAAERAQFQDAANKYFVYPVARAGITYKF